MASAGITYTADSVGISALTLGLTYSLSGATTGQSLRSVTRPIYTPPAMFLKDMHPVLQRWVKDVSKLLNDGTEGQEIITEVRNTGETLNTAVVEAKAAATEANAAAASAAETVTTAEAEITILRDELSALDVRLGVLEP